MSRVRSVALLLSTLMVLACQPVDGPTTAAPAGEEVEARIARIEAAIAPSFLIAGEPVVTPPLLDRMAQLRVPAVSVAFIQGGEIAWARAWGLADVEAGTPATTETLFQAASISKPVAATGALDLVEEGLLQLDGPVNEVLVSWKLPDNELTAASPVTLRGLATHTAGTTVHGFGGYPAGEPVPTTVGVLQGEGNSDPIVVDIEPGTRWRYSGGGYTIMQAMVEDVTGRPFDEVMQERVLEPLSMEHSTYRQPLPTDLEAQAAIGYRSDGQRLPGRWNTYPEQAAAGLWTTPSDLARWAIALQRGRAGEEHPVLEPETIAAMLTEGPLGHGLGPAIMGDGVWFGHGGSNEGYRCTIRAEIDGDEGVVIMTNSDAGGQLVTELLFTIAREYAWAGLGPRTLTPIERAAEQLSEYVGTYAGDDPWKVMVELVDGRLMGRQSWTEGQVELVPDGEDHFFVRYDATPVQFVREGGAIVAVEVQGFRFARE